METILPKGILAAEHVFQSIQQYLGNILGQPRLYNYLNTRISSLMALQEWLCQNQPASGFLKVVVKEQWVDMKWKIVGLKSLFSLPPPQKKGEACFE